MTLSVSPVEGGRDLEEFLSLPWQLYKNDRYWVPPLVARQRALLDGRAHPFREHATLQPFLARSDGRTAGRIVAIENREHNQSHGDKTGFFGFFESADDRAVAQELIDAAADWLKRRGLTAIQGPVNPSTNDECGLLIEGFDSAPTFMMPYNPPYYPALLEHLGLEKAKDLNAYYVTPEMASQDLAERMERVAQRVKARGDVLIRRPDMKRFGQEAAAIKAIYRNAWVRNWGFVAMTDAEFEELAVELKSMIVPELARMVYVGGEPAAFAFIFPDYNQPLRHANGRLWPFGLPLLLTYYYLKRITGLRLLALGVVAEHRKKGLEALMMHELYREIVASHYRWVELGWTLEDNRLINNAIEAWGARLYKRYRIYGKTL